MQWTRTLSVNDSIPADKNYMNYFVWGHLKQLAYVTPMADIDFRIIQECQIIRRLYTELASIFKSVRKWIEKHRTLSLLVFYC